MVCVAITILRRFKRSATMPAERRQQERRESGRRTRRCREAATSPSAGRRARPRRSLSIHVPTSEISWPLKKSWKLRCFSERTMSWNRERARTAAAFVVVAVSSLCHPCLIVRCNRRAALPAIAAGITSGARRLRLRRYGASGRCEQSSAGAQDAAVGPVGFAEENFSFARIGIEPARDKRQMLGQFRGRRAQAVSDAPDLPASFAIRSRCPCLSFGSRARVPIAFVRVDPRLQPLAQNRLDGARLARKFGEVGETRLGENSAQNRKHDDGLFFGGALQDHGVEIFDPPGEFRQAAQRCGDFFQALVQRGGALEIESFAGRFAFALEFRGQSDAPVVSSVSSTRPTSASYSSFVHPAKHGARHIFISE